jgi:glutaredoxin
MNTNTQKNEYRKTKKCIKKAFSDDEQETGPLSLEIDSTVNLDYSTIEKKFGFSEDSWIIYTKEGCGYCENAKQLMTKLNLNFKIISGENNKDILNIMKSINRQDFKTWPKIFKNNIFIGGYKDLQILLKQ